NWASRFEPYALHNARPVWENVMRRLLLPNGEFFFPNGNDWTLNTSVQQGYLAWIATALDEPVAALAAKRQLRSAQRRREVSPPNRILGDTNLEWWWEPLLLKRNAMALLLYERHGAPKVTAAADEYLSRGAWATLFPDGKVWVYRNANYMVSASWGRVHTGVFHPIKEDSAEMIWMTSPTLTGILPGNVTSLNEVGE